MKINMGSHPTNAANLSNDWEPPLEEPLNATSIDTAGASAKAVRPVSTGDAAERQRNSPPP
jgi:hypothetical protein